MSFSGLAWGDYVATPDPLDLLRDVLPAGYEVEGHISSGGQGSVFRGRLNGSAAAIKVYQPTADPRRIEREIAALVAIDCPYLVKVLGATTFTYSGQPHAVVAYELLDGCDLGTLVLARTQMDLTALRAVGENAAVAIEALWQRRIVHRDIKPANIVRTSSRYVVVDVGFAKHLDRSGLTVAGNPGTFGYMSPEQAGGRRNLTSRADAFSLGVTLYELAAGSHPFGRNQRLIGVVPCAPLRQHRSDLPSAFCELVDAMLHPVAHRRPDGLSERFHQL